MLDEFMKGNEIIKKFQGEIKNYYVKVRKKILFKINFGIENINFKCFKQYQFDRCIF